MTVREAWKTAENQWPDMFRVEEVETRPGTVMRRVEGKMSVHYGKPVSQQFKVRLHSYSGPVHWIAVLADGSVLVE